MKRQVVVMVSIAIVSFLVGTLFSMGFTAIGIIPNPFSKGVTDISELQTRVESLNASLIELQEKVKASPQTIRFQSPNETFIPSEPINWTRYHTITVANFTWTPKDSSNNVILSAYYWAEFKSPAPHSVSAERRLTINGAESDVHRENYGNDVGGNSYRSPQVLCWMSNMLSRSSTYTIQFRITVAYEDPIYIRNINVILIVVDGF